MNKSIVKVLKDLTSNVTNGTIGAIGKVDEISTQPPDVTTAPYNIFGNLKNDVLINQAFVVSYPYLFYAFLLLLILIIITVFTAIVTFLIRNRKRIIRQESNDALHKFQSPVRYTLFSCCPCFEKEKKHYEEPLERQNSASNLGPYRRPPLPPVRRADENEDGYKGSYIPRANQLKPIQLDAAVYGTLEKSAPSTLTKNTFSTTLDSNSPSSYRHPHYSRSTLN
uniref:Uncharacterized protein n=1 Tax=Rhabditophanes sp. KR3021 TaxID=114890 RepID=A0AC35THJ4_9BILA